MTEASDLSIGWIGAGRMGVAMAARLAPGHRVAVWNRTRAKAEPLAELGCVIADEIAELRDRDVVFTMVSTPEVLARVLLGPDGLLADPVLAPRYVVDCSTVSAEASAAVRAACVERGIGFLAAPVSGNAKVVAAGRLALAVSGPREVFDALRPLLLTFGASVTYVGVGEAARLVKICHNLLLGVLTQALAEVTVLAEKGGVARADLLAFLNASVLGSVFTRYKTPAFVELDYTPTFTPTLLRKDFDLGLAAAHDLDVPVPVAALTAQLVQAAVATGRVNEDFAILLDVQARAAGLVLEPEHADVDDGLG
ncbi:NAD(P)-dependent oxidoreductase [Nocardia panacis]|uniref:NAD(P)-dependent oxidoreductase n=1 Tax=Nocardia panacis TaxID=2340916 RepID=A0A3A4KBB8_9NOCA|nr:NAD(P)-dependent oxidoreductase [Nocardia panacis]RJO69471.1 NAD(P)-dependent oxidoreductase [Nocardia panacis]